MSELPTFLVSGERARLFPVLSDSSREGRATSIFLACLANVREFSDDLLRTVGRPIGVTSRVTCYTEIAFRTAPTTQRHRPDGLIVVKTGTSEWTALVEAKIGNAELEADQMEAYMKLAKGNQIDAVITISNQQAPSPADHPVRLDKKVLNGVTLYHWSWMDILTVADLLLTNEQVEDRDQRILLNEFRRFLSHDSTGVKGFDRMPSEWPELIRDVSAGAQISPNSADLKQVVRAWHLEMRDLSLILSRQIGVPVSLKLTKQEARHPEERLKSDCTAFSSTQCLSSQLSIPEAAADVEVTVDVRARILAASSKLAAPQDRKGTSARINWLLRQIKEAPSSDTFVRLHWPRRGYTQHTLQQLREDPAPAINSHPDLAPNALEVLMVRQTGKRFSQLAAFIEDLEALVPLFYGSIGSKLKAWQPSAPTLRPTRNESADVTPEAISEDAEEAAAKLSEEKDSPAQKRGFWF